MKIACALVLVLAAACGGSSKSEPAKPEMGEKHAEEHGPMSPELTKFHDVLAPRWHAQKGEARMKDTCGAMADFQTNADALAKVAPPAGAEQDKWQSSGKELTDAVGALDATCKAGDAAAFEPAFERVHKGFHALLEMSAGEKHAEGEPEHKM